MESHGVYKKAPGALPVLIMSALGSLCSYTISYHCKAVLGITI